MLELDCGGRGKGGEEEARIFFAKSPAHAQNAREMIANPGKCAN